MSKLRTFFELTKFQKEIIRCSVIDPDVAIEECFSGKGYLSRNLNSHCFICMKMNKQSKLHPFSKFYTRRTELEAKLLNVCDEWRSLFILMSTEDNELGQKFKLKLRICNSCVTFFKMKVCHFFSFFE